MRIEIFVVRHSKEDDLGLHIAKGAIIQMFGGLTELVYKKGYCKNQKGQIEQDSGEIWLIYTNLGKLGFIYDFKTILKALKKATRQQKQMYALNNKMYSI